MGLNNIDFSTASVRTAVALSTGTDPVMPSQAQGAFITVKTAALHYRDDGTAPTTGIGHRLEPGDNLVFDSWSVPSQRWRNVMKNITFIAVDSTTTGTISVSWFD